MILKKNCYVFYYKFYEVIWLNLLVNDSCKSFTNRKTFRLIFEII